MLSKLLNTAFCRSPSMLPVKEPLLPGQSQAASASSAGDGDTGNSGAAPAPSASKLRFMPGAVLNYKLGVFWMMGPPAERAARNEVARRINDCFHSKTPELIFDGLTTQCLPNVFEMLAHLKHLSIRGCGLTELPPSFKSLTNLETLQISRDPKRFSKWHSGDPLKFPHDLEFKKLEKLVLDNCRIGLVPEFIGRSPQLKSISLKQSRNIRLPEFLVECEKLEEIDLGEAAFDKDASGTASDPDMYGMVTNSASWVAAPLPSVKVLHMQGTTPKWMEPSIQKFFYNGLEKMPNLEELNIEGFWMVCFPPRLDNMPKLKRLILYGNPATDLELAAAMPNGCYVSSKGTSNIQFSKLAGKMRKKTNGKGPVIRSTVHYRESP